MKRQGSGWKNESRRHSLARKGIKTAKGTKIPKKPKSIIESYEGRWKGRSFSSEPIAEIFEFYDYAIWFEDLPHDEKRDLEIRDWLERLDEKFNLDFVKKWDAMNKGEIEIDNEIDFFDMVENRLRNLGHDVYLSDTRMIIWEEGTIPKWYDDEYAEYVSDNVISIPLLTDEEMINNMAWLEEKYNADIMTGFDETIQGSHDAGVRWEQLNEYLKLSPLKKKIFKELTDLDISLFTGQLLGSTYEHLHPSAKMIQEYYHLEKSDAEEIFKEFENAWWWS